MAGVERRQQVEADAVAALNDGRVDDALTIVLKGYGDELAGYLAGHSGDAELAAEAFAVGAADLWVALGQFRGACSLRTFAYTVFRHALARVARAPERRAQRRVPLSQAEHVSALQFQMLAATTRWQKTAAKNAVAALRDGLSADDRELLSLRLDRQLSWLEIATVMHARDVGVDVVIEADDAALRRRAATLRKRFERVKAQLRKDAVAAGLVGPAP